MSYRDVKPIFCLRYLFKRRLLLLVIQICPLIKNIELVLFMVFDALLHCKLLSSCMKVSLTTPCFEIQICLSYLQASRTMLIKRNVQVSTKRFASLMNSSHTSERAPSKQNKQGEQSILICYTERVKSNS